jgi:hypothetical protein
VIELKGLGVQGSVSRSSAPDGGRRRMSDSILRVTAQLVGALFAHAEELGDINDSEELPPRHSPQYP